MELNDTRQAIFRVTTHPDMHAPDRYESSQLLLGTPLYHGDNHVHQARLLKVRNIYWRE